MPKIKLKEWADKHNLSYLTANRHFHQGMIPGAIQLDSGTILVEDDSEEQSMASTTSNEAMSVFLKKTVEFSKNNSSVEDFAAFVIANFQLKLNNADNPRYSKNKPKPEEVQKHFQKFMPDKEAMEHLKAVKSLLKEGKTAGNVVPASAARISADTTAEAAAELASVLGNTTPFSRVPEINDATYDEIADDLQCLSEDSSDEEEVHTRGLITRSVDCNTTPQQINYTGSNSQAFSSTLSLNTNDALYDQFNQNSITAASLDPSQTNLNLCFNAQAPFMPTQKEVLSAAKVIETAETQPRKRGRKPSKKR